MFTFFNKASSHDPREAIFRSNHKECHFEPFKYYCHSISICGYVLFFEFYGALSFGEIHCIFFLSLFWADIALQQYYFADIWHAGFNKAVSISGLKANFQMFLAPNVSSLNAACCLATMVSLWCFRRLWDQFICVIYFPVSQHRVLLWNCGCKQEVFSKNWGILEEPKSRTTLPLSTCLSLLVQYCVCLGILIIKIQDVCDTTMPNIALAKNLFMETVTV